ncbi:MAG: CBS domain-containing protein [Nanoarchaeota archaeon]|nr:CBS domain-containing protein [Nanoarchaeota archaeon]
MQTRISVKEAMTVHPITLDVNKSLHDCAKLMKKHRIGGVLIVEKKNLGSLLGKKKLIGIVTEQDIVRKLVANGKDTLDISVKEIMETELITIGSNIDIAEAIMLMRDEDVRHLPIVEGEKLVGLITAKDILRIEPHLFDFMAAKFELREAKNKPLLDVCELCGCLTDKIYSSKGSKVCKNCKKLV